LDDLIPETTIIESNPEQDKLTQEFEINHLSNSNGISDKNQNYFFSSDIDKVSEKKSVKFNLEPILL